MTPVLAVLLLLAAAPEQKSVVVVKGETLAAIAKRELGDLDAASELAALNGLAHGAEPKKKSRLLLPGPERGRALASLRHAKGVIAASPAGSAAEAAGAVLSRAWEAFRGARYTEAESLAAASERRLAGETTRFSIVVEPKTGESRFLVHEGAVDVSAAGKTATARRGEAVRAANSRAPRMMSGAPAAPLLVLPRDSEVIARDGGVLRWSDLSGAGASSFQVTVARDLLFVDRIATFAVAANEIMVPAGLPKGVYYWRVAGVSPEGVEGPAAGPRSFVLTREPKAGTDWEWGPIWDPWGIGVSQ